MRYFQSERFVVWAIFCVRGRCSTAVKTIPFSILSILSPVLCVNTLLFLGPFIPVIQLVLVDPTVMFFWEVYLRQGV